MGSRHPRRRLRLAFGLVLLLAVSFLLGCSDSSPTAPKPSTGSWQTLGLAADFVEVDDITTWNDLLILGGHLHQFQGHLETNLVTWDGTTWSRLEPPGPATVLAVYDGDLIAGGPGSNDTTSTLSAYDGTQWTPIDSQLSHRSVTALVLYEGDLVAGVLTSSNGGDNVSSVERWNGTSWQLMGGELDGYVSDFTVHQGHLYVAGSFQNAGGVPAKRIASWNGLTWDAVGGGFEGDVNSTGNVLSLTTDGTTLFAGGDFRTAGGVPAVNVARWNGAVWDSLGAGLVDPNVSSWINALAMDGGSLVAGGVFGVNPVRRWTGSEWTPMSTLGGSVRVFATHNGSFIAGGYFPPSGTQTANGIAKWVP